jgi:hypothetical protein
VSSVPGHAVKTGLLRLLIIDRYLLRQFWHTFVICFCSLTGLYIVIDAFGNLEEFINYAHKHGSLLGVMGELSRAIQIPAARGAHRPSCRDNHRRR